MTKFPTSISGSSINSSIISSTKSNIGVGTTTSIIVSYGINITGINNIALGSKNSYINPIGGINVTSKYSSLISSTSSQILRASNSTIIGATSATMSGGSSTIGNSVIIGGTGGKILSYVSSAPNRSVVMGGASNTILQTGGTASNLTIIGGNTNKMNITGGTVTGNIILGGDSNSLNKYLSTGSLRYSAIIAGNLNKILHNQGSVNTRNNLIAGGRANLIASINGITSQYSSIIGGQLNTALTSNSIVLGGTNNYLKNSKTNGILGGSNNTIKECYSSTIVGAGNSIINGGSIYTSTADYSFIGGGQSNSITGNSSAILAGSNNLVAHNYAVAMGGGSKTRGNLQLVIGNQPTLTANVANNRIRLDAVAGSGVATAGFAVGVADFAEYFEWQDGNINNENRLGYFVSLIDGKVKIGNTNIIGIVSSAPGFLGDAAELAWGNMYSKDEWNREIFITYTKYSWINDNKEVVIFEDESGRKMTQFPNPGYPLGLNYNGDVPSSATTSTFKTPKMNPDYDPNSDYIPRSERKEWIPIGLLGKLHVRTAEPIIGKSIDVNSNGMAINGTKYMVLNKVREHTNSQYGIVRIFFK